MAVLVASLLVILGGGCAWRSADAAPPNARDLAGVWHGDIVQPGGSLYTVEARAVLEINADGTFTATVTPLLGANNLARPSSWSGTVTGDGSRVTFRIARGPRLMLIRSAEHLYGMANDPSTAMDVLIDFERERPARLYLAFTRSAVFTRSSLAEPRPSPRTKRSTSLPPSWVQVTPPAELAD
jgi:hypothetical protein